MAAAIFFGAYFIGILIIGWISNALGITQGSVDLVFLNEPGSGNIISNLLAPLKWGWNALQGFGQLMLFRARGIGIEFIIIMFWFLHIVSVWIFIRLIRGGG